LSACPSQNWIVLTKQDKLEQYHEIHELSYEVVLVAFLVIVSLLIIFSCKYEGPSQKKKETNNVSWLPTWSRRKSSAHQYFNNMKKWDLRRHSAESQPETECGSSRTSSIPILDHKHHPPIPNLRSMVDNVLVNQTRHIKNATTHVNCCLNQTKEHIQTATDKVKPFTSVIDEIKRRFDADDLQMMH
jgi:hypothetical protein